MNRFPNPRRLKKLWLANDLRAERLKYAVLFSVLSKVVRMVTQTFIIGLSVRYLGEEVYGIWLTSLAAFGWLSWGQAGLAPGLINSLATAEGEGRREDQQTYFTTALTVVVAIALALLLLGQVTVNWQGDWFSGLISLNEEADTANSQVEVFLQLALVLALIRIPLGIIESAFVGIQSIHIVRIFDILGQCFCLLAAFGLALGDAANWLFLLGIGLTTELGVLVAGVYLVSRVRPDLRPSISKFDLRASSQMFDLSFGYLIVQVAGYIVAHAGILILAAHHGAAAVPIFTITWKLYQMASGLWMMVMTALWGALGDANAKGDMRWVRSAIRRILGGSMAISLIFSCILALAGQRILNYWTDGNVIGEPIFFLAMALYSSVFTWAVLCAQILSALNLIWKQIWAAVANGALALLFALALVPSLGATGLAVALLTSCLCTTAWVYPLMLNNVLKRGKNVTTKLN